MEETTKGCKAVDHIGALLAKFLTYLAKSRHIMAMVFQGIGVCLVEVTIYLMGGVAFKLMMVVPLIVGLYTGLGRCFCSCKDPRGINNYIWLLAVGDTIVLAGLMAFTDGVKSPFSPLLFTIPILAYLLDLPFYPYQRWVFFAILGVIILVSIIYFPLSKIPILCFVIVSIVSLFVILWQAYNDYLISYKDAKENT